ncbi:MAG: dipeptidase [Bacteroidia bacterium]|nr:dipeptidase [Bacteroidia bacterium]
MRSTISRFPLRRLSLFSALLCVVFTPMHAQEEDYVRLHREAVVVDGHNDVLGRVVSGTRVDVRGSTGHSDLPRFREGELDVQVFSIWVHPKKGVRDGWISVRAQLDSLHAIAKRHPSQLRLVRTAREFDAASAAGALAAVISIEGSSALDGKPERIRELHAKGLRVFAPTWNYSVDWASSSVDEAAGKKSIGLTHHGKRLVRLLDSLGIILDISHLGARAAADALSVTRNPVIASHSSCAALRPHHRNLTDEQLRTVAKRGGVVMINFFPPFLLSGMTSAKVAATRKLCTALDILAAKHPRRGTAFLKEYDRLLASARKSGLPTLLDVADHIDHAVRIAGAASVGLGSDFDGIPYAPAGLHDVTWLPMLTRELLRRGHSEGTVEGILGKNFLRVFRQVCKE